MCPSRSGSSHSLGEYAHAARGTCAPAGAVLDVKVRGGLEEPEEELVPATSKVKHLIEEKRQIFMTVNVHHRKLSMEA